MSKNNKMDERNGTFDDVDHLIADINNAYRNQMFPDVTFVLSDEVTIQTNRFMLACRSEYFAAKLFALREDEEKVVMNCDSNVFQLLLDYIWKGRVDFSNLELHHLLDLLQNARMMGLKRLVANVQKYLSYLLEVGHLDNEEYWTVLDFCANNGYEEILTSTLKFIDANFNTFCSSKTDFSKLSRNIIFIILENKNRIAPEIDI